MNVLAIDTVTQACSVALLTGSQSYQQAKYEANQHSALLLDMVDAVLQQATLALSNVDLIAVNNGPGSFTGIRIGVGVAQGLAYGADIPVLGVNSLAILATQNKAKGSILSMIDARMGQVYWGVFPANPVNLSSLGWQNTALHLTKPEQIRVDKGAENFSIIASGCDHYTDRFSFDVPESAAHFDAYPMANGLASLAANVESADYQSAQALTPVYLRNDVASVSARKRH